MNFFTLFVNTLLFGAFYKIFQMIFVCFSMFFCLIPQRFFAEFAKTLHAFAMMAYVVALLLGLVGFRAAFRNFVANANEFARSVGTFLNFFCIKMQWTPASFPASFWAPKKAPNKHAGRTAGRTQINAWPHSGPTRKSYSKIVIFFKPNVPQFAHFPEKNFQKYAALKSTTCPARPPLRR